MTSYVLAGAARTTPPAAVDAPSRRSRRTGRKAAANLSRQNGEPSRRSVALQRAALAIKIGHSVASNWKPGPSPGGAPEPFCRAQPLGRRSSIGHSALAGGHLASRGRAPPIRRSGRGGSPAASASLPFGGASNGRILDDRRHGAHTRLMTPGGYLASISADVDRIGAVGSAGIDCQVPSCPDWDVADLVRHVGVFHRYVTYLAGLPDGGHEAPEGWASAAKQGRALRADSDLVSWLREGADSLMQALRDAPASTSTHTFYGVTDPSLLMRRVATETAVHRWDAEGVTGTQSPLDPVLAAEGLDEYLELLMPLFFHYSDFAGTGQTISLEPTDGGDGAWVITTYSDTTEWRHSVEEPTPTSRSVVAEATSTSTFWVDEPPTQSRWRATLRCSRAGVLLWASERGHRCSASVALAFNSGQEPTAGRRDPGSGRAVAA